jgi:hypothetical protein
MTWHSKSGQNQLSVDRCGLRTNKSIREIGETILNTPEVSAAVRGGAVLRVKAEGGLNYEIATANCKATVGLKAHPPREGLVGKTVYSVDSIESPCN